MKIAILTGASAGLGREYFHAIAQQHPEIDQIWMIARRGEAMEKIANEIPNMSVRLLPMDLTKKESYKELSDLLKAENPTVSLLVNNAGCGRLGNVIDENWEDQVRQTDLNVSALTAVTNICLPYMPKEKKSGSGIIFVCSIASFCPNPRMTVYSSTKAYVLSYAKGLSFELKKTGIHMLCVCPGPMRTEFLGVAGIGKGSSKTFDTLPYTKPDAVAKKSVRLVKKKSGIYTPRAFFKFYRFLAKFIPHGIMMHAAKT